jgi:hypothetical protein
VVELELRLSAAVPAAAAVPQPDQLFDIVRNHVAPLCLVLWLHVLATIAFARSMRARSRCALIRAGRTPRRRPGPRSPNRCGLGTASICAHRSSAAGADTPAALLGALETPWGSHSRSQQSGLQPGDGHIPFPWKTCRNETSLRHSPHGVALLPLASTGRRITIRNAVLQGLDSFVSAPRSLPGAPVAHHVRPDAHHRHPEDRVREYDCYRYANHNPQQSCPSMERSEECWIVELFLKSS